MPESWRDRADDAMATLARERGKALTGYAYLLTGDLRDAEDLVQDALVKTFVRRRSGLIMESAEAYVRRAILTTYIDASRRRGRWQEIRHIFARTETYDGPAEATADRADVVAALRSLAPQQRACIVLRFYDDLTVPEIADRLGLGDGTVKRYLSLGVRRLEALLGVVAVTDEPDVVLEGGRS